VAFLSYIQMFFRPIRDIAEKYNIMQSAMASTERIVEFLDHKEEIPEPEHPVVPEPVLGHLRFEHVSFGYRKGVPVLKDVTFEVKPGEMVAIVGATGAGKTTVVNLIERFYDPLEGRVLLDNEDLRHWPKKALQRHIGLVMQDVFIFSGSLADNILLGDDKQGPRPWSVPSRRRMPVPSFRNCRKAWSRISERRALTCPPENASFSPLQEPWLTTPKC